MSAQKGLSVICMGIQEDCYVLVSVHLKRLDSAHIAYIIRMNKIGGITQE